MGAGGAQDLLRFITCGSVDDGKSTLIGRLLHDTRQIFDDQLGELAAPGGGVDFALLVDGLSAEREQGITIDVAYRYFGTAKRRFIVADTPGHEQYTRNMVTGASTAELAVLLVDARKGVLIQTKRHSLLARLVGIRKIVLAVTKMDLVDYDQAAFAAAAADYRAFADAAGIGEWVAIPVSGTNGDNVVARSAAMPWYEGPSLLEHLESVPLIGDADARRPLRLPVQYVVRPNQDFRGFAGQVASGTVGSGDEVRLLPSGRTSKVTRVLLGEAELERAVAGQSVTVTLADDVDCARGDVIAGPDDPPQAADQFQADLVWMAEAELVPGRGYWLKLGTRTVNAAVHAPKYALNVNTQEHLAAKTLGLNDIGLVELTTDEPLVFEPYADSRALGGFILIDKISNATVGAGMIHFALRRAQNVHWQHIDVSREMHAAQKGQQAAVVWLTGLSGAGKSTIANLVEKKLLARGRHTFLLDGDNVRHRLNKDLGFTEADRIENIRRVGEVARLMSDAGLIVITAFISPFRAERAMVRAMMAEGEFIEVFVDSPLEVAEARDPKGLYAKARAGELANFTGIDSPYEPPELADIRIDTTKVTAEQAADAIVATLIERQKV
jgi:bifunctional enzyme CysN/CysC